MAKLTDITELSSSVADDNLIHVVDIKDNSQDPAGSSFKLQLITLYNWITSKLDLSLQNVLNAGNSTGGTNILVETSDAIELKNGSLLKEGTYDFGGNKGISKICSVGYEDNWQSGIRHVFDNSGFIRKSSNCFNIIPDNTFDNTLRFKIDSRWVLDNGDVYVCSDASTGAAVWGLVSNTGGISHATASGTDTYTATVTGVTTYADGDAYLIRFTNGNTTNCTLNINSLGAIALYRNNDGALIGGDIQANGEMLCVYNSANNNFQAIGTSPNSLISYVTNDDSVTLTKGMPVYAFSGVGDRLTVKRAYNTLDSTSAQTIGLVMSTSIGANQKGFIMMQGLLDGLSILPTSTWTDGSPVYLGSTAGTITNVKPYAPNHLVYLGFVTTASNGSAGRLYIRVQNGYELDELHNVQAQSPTLKDTLYYDDTVSPAQWKTASISTILGYTPENTTNKSSSYTSSSTTTYANTKALVDGLATKADYAPRVQSVTSSATVTPTSTNDLVKITAQAAGLTIANPTGTMNEGQSLMIRIKDNGTAQTIGFGTNYRAVGITLPTTTVISKTLYLGCIWNDTDTKFDVIGLSQQA